MNGLVGVGEPPELHLRGFGYVVEVCGYGGSTFGIVDMCWRFVDEAVAMLNCGASTQSTRANC